MVRRVLFDGLRATGVEVTSGGERFILEAKEKSIRIDHVADPGISLGIYFHDPDGNGIEVYYELPRSQWVPRGTAFHARG